MIEISTNDGGRFYYEDGKYFYTVAQFKNEVTENGIVPGYKKYFQQLKLRVDRKIKLEKLLS